MVVTKIKTTFKKSTQKIKGGTCLLQCKIVNNFPVINKLCLESASGGEQRRALQHIIIAIFHWFN